ncbi:hypothetical protein Vi05172_g6093 [Venturia inaequalis]|nr:hypothetical protein Vi05172_g6093 [Venturia inaequalis]
MYLANISSAAVLLLYITPSLASSCCLVDNKDNIIRKTGYTKRCCKGYYIPDSDLCKLTNENQRIPLISCCADGGRRPDVKPCYGECVPTKYCWEKPS